MVVLLWFHNGTTYTVKQGLRRMAKEEGRVDGGIHPKPESHPGLAYPSLYAGSEEDGDRLAPWNHDGVDHRTIQPFHHYSELRGGRLHLGHLILV